MRYLLTALVAMSLACGDDESPTPQVEVDAGPTERELQVEADCQKYCWSQESKPRYCPTLGSQADVECVFYHDECKYNRGFDNCAAWCAENACIDYRPSSPKI